MLTDIHVHIAGVDYERNGNYLSKKILNSIPFRSFMLSCGIKRKALKNGDVDARFAKIIIDWIDQSHLDRAVLLAYDAVYRPDGELDWDNTHMLTGNDYVRRLAAENESILFGASVHPYRKNAIQELERVINDGAQLIKWLPTGQNIDLKHPKCVPFYQLLASTGVPLLCHTGGEKAVVNLNNEMNDPAYLRTALDYGVTVIAAHCGSHSIPWETGYYETWRSMALEYDNLYGDLAAFGLPGRTGVMKRILDENDIQHKLVYGSDCPVFSVPIWYMRSLGFSKALRLQLEKNPLDKAYLTMKEIGVDQAVFTRASDLLGRQS